MKICYFGYNIDTINWGCRSTPEALLQIIKSTLSPEKIFKFSNSDLLKKDFKEIKNIIKECDLVIINGEGSPIFRSSIRKEFNKHLMVVEYCGKINKKCLYVNTMISKCPKTTFDSATYSRALSAWSKCELVLRDPVSGYLIDGKLEYSYVPDALFTWHTESVTKVEDYILLGGGSFPPKHGQVENKKASYIKLINKLSNLKKVKLVQNCNGDNWMEPFATDNGLELIHKKCSIDKGMEILQKSQVYISGRFHPAIMASLNGTPCIFFESNSDKTMYLQKMLNYENPVVFNFPLTEKQINKIYDLTKYYLDHNVSVREKIRKQAKFLCEQSKTGYEKILNKYK